MFQEINNKPEERVKIQINYNATMKAIDQMYVAINYSK